jgi:hypothetical protein
MAEIRHSAGCGHSRCKDAVRDFLLSNMFKRSHRYRIWKCWVASFCSVTWIESLGTRRNSQSRSSDGALRPKDPSGCLGRWRFAPTGSPCDLSSRANLGPQLAPWRYLSRLELAGRSLQDQVQALSIPPFEAVKQDRSCLSQQRQGFA